MARSHSVLSGKRLVTEDCVDELMSLSSTRDPRFKNLYNNNRIKSIGRTVTGEPLAMVTEDDSPTPDPSTASAQATTAEPRAGDEDYFQKPQEFRVESQQIAIEKEIQSYYIGVNPLDWR
ncbi:E3 SUMO-protein ligase ZBED1-like [Tachysurus ichikawai]